MPEILTGNEAVARGALHAGIAAAYSYPGTPATEITEYVMAHAAQSGNPVAVWTANEKTAYEAALGVSLTGGRALVAMKHVGLNVAADPFINSALTSINGGLVLAVADDPGMHSSQNEQDSRFYADFAKIICLEPSSQQEAYEMSRLGFELSEQFHIPVMLRLVTRIAHGRSTVVCTEASHHAHRKPRFHTQDEWVLLPSISRKLWDNLVHQYDEFITFSEQSTYNTLSLAEKANGTAVITTGIARQYYLENRPELPDPQSHLHIGVYPFPVQKIRSLLKYADKVLVIEEGYPYIEKFLRGILPQPLAIHGRMDETIPATGELSPDSVRRALGLPVRMVIPPPVNLPHRPPQFCKACPHIDSFSVLQDALKEHKAALITSDIGCYTLGALPPYQLLDSTVCMGASIGMAKGVADNGDYPVVAVIGDSTFLHSGMTSLLDAVASNTDMTVLILDNEVIAMTGTQPTIVPSNRLQDIVKGLGVATDHIQVLQATKAQAGQNAAVLKREIAFHGLSVVIMHRECIVAAKRKRSTNEV